MSRYWCVLRCDNSEKGLYTITLTGGEPMPHPRFHDIVRALGILDSTEKTGKMDCFGCDPLACLFCKGGWYERVQERLNGSKKI